MGIFQKIDAARDVYSEAEQLADAVRTKRWTLAINSLGTLVLLVLNLAHAFGYLAQFGITSEQMEEITAGAVALLGLFNHAGTVNSTDKIDGLGRAQPVQPVAPLGALATAPPSAGNGIAGIATDTQPGLRLVDQAQPVGNGNNDPSNQPLGS